MATTNQIDRAAARDRVPVGAEYMASDHLLAMPAADREYALQEIARATRAVHRIARGQQAAAEVLEALGLTPYRYDPPPEAVPTKECRRCHTAKPITGFYGDQRNRDRLDSYCKPCRNALRGECRRRANAKAKQNGPATGQATKQNGTTT